MASSAADLETSTCCNCCEWSDEVADWVMLELDTAVTFVVFCPVWQQGELFVRLDKVVAAVVEIVADIADAEAAVVVDDCPLMCLSLRNYCPNWNDSVDAAW